MEQKLVTPLKAGLLIVAITYFLFTLHATFVLSWIGEWEGLLEPTRTWILVTDVSAYITLIFRFIAGLLAVSTIIFYLAKKGLPQTTLYRLLKVIITFEAIYWIGLLLAGIWGIVPTPYGDLKIPFTQYGFNSSLLLSTGIPCMVGSIGIPVSLFMLARKLSPNKPQKAAIKWAMTAGVFYTLTLWLNNTGMWIITEMQSEIGFGFITSTPQYLISFIATLGGLLALAIYMAYFARKSMKAERIEDVSINTVGAILIALGTYFLWNYLTWIFFGGWNQWYAWILGHNLDLWMLSLPLVGIPLLFYNLKNRSSS